MKKFFEKYDLSALLVFGAGLLGAALLAYFCTRNVDKYSYSEEKAQQITTGLLKISAENGDERSAADLLAWYRLNTPPEQMSRPLLWKTSWSAMSVVSLYGQKWPVRFEMWSITHPATVRDIELAALTHGRYVAEPAEVGRWVNLSAVPGSVWPLETRNTLAATHRIPRVDYVRESGKGGWKQLATRNFPVQGGTDVLLLQFLPGTPANYGL